MPWIQATLFLQQNEIQATWAASSGAQQFNFSVSSIHSNKLNEKLLKPKLKQLLH